MTDLIGVMPLSTLKKLVAPLSSASNLASGLSRDILWDRPLFRPPVLSNPRVIFDPLPFTATRLNASVRQHTKS